MSEKITIQAIGLAQDYAAKIGAGAGRDISALRQLIESAIYLRQANSVRVLLDDRDYVAVPVETLDQTYNLAIKALDQLEIGDGKPPLILTTIIPPFGASCV